MSNLEEKKIFLVASALEHRRKWIEDLINKHISKATIFIAPDGLMALGKLQNAPPHVVITEPELPKSSPYALVDATLKMRGAESTAIIVLGSLPAEGVYLDEIVTGKIRFSPAEENEVEFKSNLVKALNFSSHSNKADFYLRFLTPGDVLIRQGEKGEFVYFVKKGTLEAFRDVDGKTVTLGQIQIGEFVGEMSYINGEPRSASVRAVTDCELIEVPIGTFDQVLFKRPSWSKALMLTLSKRLKAANSEKIED